MDTTEPRQAATSAETLGYTNALSELDDILRELEGSDVDVDHLAERVTRASELITLCRDKITNAQLAIEQVTADLDAAATIGTLGD